MSAYIYVAIWLPVTMGVLQEEFALIWNFPYGSTQSVCYTSFILLLLQVLMYMCVRLRWLSGAMPYS